MKTGLFIFAFVLSSEMVAQYHHFVLNLHPQKQSNAIRVKYEKTGIVEKRGKHDVEMKLQDEVNSEIPSQKKTNYKSKGLKIFHIEPLPGQLCKTKHFVGVNIVPLLADVLAIDYEYMNFKRHLGFKMTAMVGKGEAPKYYYGEYSLRNTVFNGGLDLNYYLCLRNHRCDRVQVYFGPSVSHGAFKYDFSNSYLYPKSGLIETHIGYKTTIMLKANVSLRIIKPLYVSFSLGIGKTYFNKNYKNPDPLYYVDSRKDIPGNYYQNADEGSAEINIGIKF